MNGKKAKRQRTAAMLADVEESKSVVVRFLRDSVNKLRQEYARRLKIIRRHDPDGAAALGDALKPCATCAFRTSADFTDGDDGFLQTSCMLVAALDKGAAFLCHLPKQEGDEDYRPRDYPCIGWLTLQSPIPGPFAVRELLGDVVVDTMVEGSRILNPERHAKP